VNEDAHREPIHGLDAAGLTTGEKVVGACARHGQCQDQGMSLSMVAVSARVEEVGMHAAGCRVSVSVLQ